MNANHPILPPKNLGIAYILWFFLGLFTLPSQVRMVNTQRSVGIG